MSWEIEFCSEFETEFELFAVGVQDEIVARARVLGEFGPSLGRPNVDTLKGSRHKNMKELRFNTDDGVWRVAFAFDPERKAIFLVAGDKSGGSESRFYKSLIKKADDRFDVHLEELETNKKKQAVKN